MTILVWAELYDNASQRFGNTTAGSQLEQQLVDHFQRHPVAVQQAIEKLADRYAAGKVHTPWPLVLKELEREDERADITSRADPERDRAIRLAENYIRNAAHYCPTEAELLNEIFGPHGKLRAWAEDTELRDRIRDRWNAEHPRALTAEKAARDRAQAITTSRTDPGETPARLAAQAAWIEAGGWTNDDLETAILDRFPMTSTGDLDQLHALADQCEARELGTTPPHGK